MSTITGTAIFTDTSSNAGTITTAEFKDYSVNEGTILSAASFSLSSTNKGIVQGNATFVGKTINDTAATINGSTVFSGEAVNSGTVINAIFSESAKNLGTVVNGTFTGFSSNEGSVTTGIFTETTTTNTGVVTNPTVVTGFTNAGTFTNTANTYTQTDGAFSYGYFSGGIKTAPPNYQTVVYLVGNFWYKYDASGNAALAQGEYSDGTNTRIFKNGIKVNVGVIILSNSSYYYELPLAQGSILYTNGDLTAKAVAANGAGLDIDGNLEEDEWVISAGGAVTWGDIARFGAYIDGYYSNDTIVSGYTNTTPQTARNSVGNWYVYTAGLAASANGAYTNGYFTEAIKGGTYTIPQSALDNSSAWFVYTSGVPTSATGSYTVGKFSSGVKTGTTSTPVTALDNSAAYYVYASGDPSLASGAYSIGYFTAGTISNYTNIIPFTPQDSALYYVYNAGVASTANGLYGNGAYLNGVVDNTITSTAPQQAIDTKWYMYVTGAVSVTADGSYSNGYYAAGTKNESYANTLPQSAANEVNKWYVYTNGAATGASGAYTNGYYVNSELSGTFTTPQSALNNSNLWYVYTDGVALTASGTFGNIVYTYGVRSLLGGATPYQSGQLWYVFTNGVEVTASGAYTNGYYSFGTKTSDSYTTPQSAQDNNTSWFVYTAGTPVSAAGAYSNGYYTDGLFETNYSVNVPISALDNSLWYVYTNGVSLTASGAYKATYYVYGTVSTENINTPLSAKDDVNKWYVYTTGIGLTAEGAYSNGYYVYGSPSGTFASPITAKDDTLFYTYTAGVATLATGYYQIAYFSAGVKSTAPLLTPGLALDGDKYYIYTAFTTTASGVSSLGVPISASRHSSGYEEAGTVSIDETGNKLMVGLRLGYNSAGNQHGLVRTYEWTGTQWLTSTPPVENVTNSLGKPPYVNNEANAEFLGAMDISRDGKTFVKSNPGHDLYGVDAGLLEIYKYTLLPSISSTRWGPASAVWVKKGNSIYGRNYRNFFDQVSYPSTGGTNAEQYGAFLAGTLSKSVVLNNTGNVLIFGTVNGYTPDSWNPGRLLSYVYNPVKDYWRQLPGRSDVLSDPNTFADAFQSGGGVFALNTHGDRIIVGLPTLAGAQNNPYGGARVYKWTGSDWTTMGWYLTSARAKLNDRFGTAVAMDQTGNIVAIGSRGNSSERTILEIYRWNGTTWTQMGSTLSGTNVNSSFFSSDLSFNSTGDRLIVGERGVAVGSIAAAGRVLIYDWNGTDWVTYSDPLSSLAGIEASSEYGKSVDINGDGTVIVVGAPKERVNKGIVRGYRLNKATITSVSGVLVSGLYSNGYYDNGTKLSNYNSLSGLPEQVLDNSLYYIFTNGVPVTANGAYPNGYFTYGTRSTSYSSVNLLPEQISFNNKYYVYNEGFGYIADGSFGETGYYVNGLLSATATVRLPVYSFTEPLFYTYSNGVAASANGAYSNGYFINGVQLSSASVAVTPTSALDNSNNWFIYDRVGLALSATGVYSIGLFNNGTKTTSTSSVPITAADNGLWYTYTNGVPLTANGYYLNGIFSFGVRLTAAQTTAALTTPLTAIGTADKYYIYSPTPSNVYAVLTGNEINGSEALAQQGWTVSLNAAGDRLATGAHFGLADDSGYVSTFYWNRTSSPTLSGWRSLAATLSGEAAGDRFSIVTLNSAGNVLAVGSQFNDGADANAGSVRVYELSTSAGVDLWVQRGSDINGLSANDYFGSSVSLNAAGNRLAVGSPYSDISGTDRGLAKVFDWDGSNWNQVGQSLSGVNAGDLFGTSIKLNESGNIIIVGGPLFDGSTTNAGLARVFELSGGLWVQRGANLVVPRSQTLNENFGFSVTINNDGTVVAVGAATNSNNVGSYTSGAVYVYNWTGSAWKIKGEVNPLSNTDRLALRSGGSYWGYSLDINKNGDQLVVGAPWEGGYIDGPGTVKVYNFLYSNNVGSLYNGVSGAWINRGEFLPANGYPIAEAELVSNGGSNTLFGWSVSMNDEGSLIAVGIPKNTPGNNTASLSAAGSTRVFRLSARAPFYWSPQPANGAYSSGFFYSGEKSISYNSLNGAPQVVNDSNLMYTFTNGIATIANGLYSTGYFVNGALSSTATFAQPQSAINDGLWYTFTNGVGLTANGAYSNYYFSYGTISNGYTNATAQAAIDNGLNYTYTNGVASLYTPAAGGAVETITIDYTDYYF